MSENKNVHDDDKLDINKSVFQSSRDLKKKAAEEEEARQLEIQRKIEARERKKREAYDRRIYEEKKELMRLKQGLIEDSEMVREEAAVEEKRTLWQKISSFFYLNKWWLGIALAVVLIVGFLVYNFLQRPRPDMKVLVVTKSSDMTSSDGLTDYLQRFCKDNNKNGEILVAAVGVSMSDNEYVNYQMGNDTKLTAELESADSVIVIGDGNLDKIVDPEMTFADLEQYFPDNDHVKGCKFMLYGTDLAEKAGIPDELMTYDLYIAIRKPTKLLYSSESEMQKVYDRDIKVLTDIINDLS